jgi:hypothetical protein
VTVDGRLSYAEATDVDHGEAETLLGRLVEPARRENSPSDVIGAGESAPQSALSA